MKQAIEEPKVERAWEDTGGDVAVGELPCRAVRWPSGRKAASRGSCVELRKGRGRLPPVGVGRVPHIQERVDTGGLCPP